MKDEVAGPTFTSYAPLKATVPSMAAITSWIGAELRRRDKWLFFLYKANLPFEPHGRPKLLRTPISIYGDITALKLADGKLYSLNKFVDFWRKSMSEHQRVNWVNVHNFIKELLKR